MQNLWTEEELRHAVKTYIDMLNFQAKGVKYNKSEQKRDLLSRLPKRDSVDHRLSNISYVLKDNGYDTVEGFKPQKNVGTNYSIILRIYEELVNKEIKSELPIESIDEERIRRNAAITGNKAEKEFEKYALENLGWSVENKSDDHGLGYDFLCYDNDNKKLFVEIKGCKQNIEDIRMTKREWIKSEESPDNYILYIVSNLDFEPEFNRYDNPFELFRNNVKIIPTLTHTWHIKKKDLVLKN